jgi:hypothetical protein
MSASERIVQEHIGEQIVTQSRTRQDAIDTLRRLSNFKSAWWRSGLTIVVCSLAGANAADALETSWGQVAAVAMLSGTFALALEAYHEARVTRKKLDAALSLIALDDLSALKNSLK